MEFDSEKLANIRSGDAFKGPEAKIFTQLELLDVSELLQLRDRIDARLPATTLSGMNLEEELVRQYLKVQELQAWALEDPDTPANQRAQVCSTVANTLQHLVRMQTEFHTAERFKAIENLMIKHFKTLPLEVVEAFIKDYEAIK